MPSFCFNFKFFDYKWWHEESCKLQCVVWINVSCWLKFQYHATTFSIKNKNRKHRLYKTEYKNTYSSFIGELSRDKHICVLTGWIYGPRGFTHLKGLKSGLNGRGEMKFVAKTSVMFSNWRVLPKIKTRNFIAKYRKMTSQSARDKT